MLRFKKLTLITAPLIIMGCSSGTQIDSISQDTRQSPHYQFIKTNIPAQSFNEGEAPDEKSDIYKEYALLYCLDNFASAQSIVDKHCEEQGGVAKADGWCMTKGTNQALYQMKVHEYKQNKRQFRQCSLSQYVTGFLVKEAKAGKKVLLTMHGQSEINKAEEQERKVAEHKAKMKEENLVLAGKIRGMLKKPHDTVCHNNLNTGKLDKAAVLVEGFPNAGVIKIYELTKSYRNTQILLNGKRERLVRADSWGLCDIHDQENIKDINYIRQMLQSRAKK